MSKILTNYDGVTMRNVRITDRGTSVMLEQEHDIIFISKEKISEFMTLINKEMKS